MIEFNSLPATAADTTDQITTTGELVTEQAPTMVTTPATLPADYLSHGYYATANNGTKYLRPEYVSIYAEEIAGKLETMKPADFVALMRELKRSKKKALPFEARQTATAEMLPKALALVKRHKAPVLLVGFIRVNLAVIHNDDDFMAFYRHMEAVSGFLSFQTGGERSCPLTQT